ncbi:MAG: formate dehydrogenase subunit gamma, partial [Rhodocyclaceae bacterium]|nr:formate dehydrogenase subunit gamma [Rhodocyclaceae bacterium]
MLRKFGFFTRMTGAVLTGLTVATLLLPLSAQAADPPIKAPAVAEAPAASAQAAPAAASVPHNAAATWRDARGGIAGVTTVRGTETGVLISAQGNTWRAIRNGLITPYGGALLLTVAGLILLFYKKSGTIKLHTPKTGRSMERFTLNERRAHWLVAISFVCLALSGIILLFGKHIFLW